MDWCRVLEIPEQARKQPKEPVSRIEPSFNGSSNETGQEFQINTTKTNDTFKKHATQSETDSLSWKVSMRSDSSFVNDTVWMCQITLLQ